MRLIDADLFKENILNGLYVFCQENKEDIARAIDDEPTFGTFKEICCDECEKCQNAYDEGYEFGITTQRPQGEWELHGMIYYCSECGHECGESGDNFCGNCGADMRGNNNG